MPIKGINRVRLGRILDLNDAVPFPKPGLDTTAFMAYAAFVNDIRVFRPALNRVLLAILMDGVDDLPDPDANPDVLLTRLEEWVKDRQRHQWDSPTPPLPD